MKALYLAKDKEVTHDGLRLLLAMQSVDVTVCAMGHSQLFRDATDAGCRVVEHDTLYEVLPRLGDIDLVLSFYYWTKIHRPLIDLPRIACVNFHPAPLPAYRGAWVYNWAVLNCEAEWFVTAHCVTERFDAGPVLAVSKTFKVLPGETAYSLSRACERPMLNLLNRVVDNAQRGKPQILQQYEPNANTYTRAETDAQRRILTTDDAETADRKRRAFYYPPWPGVIELEQQ